MLEPKSQNKYMFTGCKTESQEKKDEKHLDCHSFFPFSLSLDIYICVCVYLRPSNIQKVLTFLLL